MIRFLNIFKNYFIHQNKANLSNYKYYYEINLTFVNNVNCYMLKGQRNIFLN